MGGGGGGSIIRHRLPQTFDSDPFSVKARQNKQTNKSDNFALLQVNEKCRQLHSYFSYAAQPGEEIVLKLRIADTDEKGLYRS